MRTTIYVDGLNLYYRILRGSNFKWLNLSQLFATLLDPKYKINHINYYYANVKILPFNPGAPERQNVYLNALKTLKNVNLVKGGFSKKYVEKHLSMQPHDPVKVIIAQEKGSDVNLATNLLNDAWKNKYDAAFVVSCDPDLKEGMRLVKQEFTCKEVNLITPGLRKNASRELYALADHHLEIKTKDLRVAQFPNTIGGTNITKPSLW